MSAIAWNTQAWRLAAVSRLARTLGRTHISSALPIIQPASAASLSEVLRWLKAEADDNSEGFYCNRSTITKRFEAGDGVCAVEGSEIVGFAVFQMFDDGGEVLILEVKPSARFRGLGSDLLKEAVNRLKERGAKYVEAECTSQAGESLCRRHGFEDYVEPENHQSEWDNPTLRLYLSAWRPRPPHPWA